MTATASISNHQSAIANPQGEIPRQTRDDKPGRRAQFSKQRHNRGLKILFGMWKDLKANLDYPGVETDDELRHVYAAQKLGGAELSVVSRQLSVTEDRKLKTENRSWSWSKLSREEMGGLAHAMRVDLERTTAHQRGGVIIGKLAVELFGSAWDRMLSDRLQQRWRKSKPGYLTPGELHAEIEELMSRVARMRGVEIEVVRAGFSR
jgi:hypothetical protein